MKGSLLVLCTSLLLSGILTFSSMIPAATLESRTTNFSADSPNLGIASISATKNVVGLNRRLSLGINVTNYGTATETFNATFYANSTIINEIPDVTVDGQNFTIVVFKWTVVGFAYGNYSISASITPVFNETELSDNFIDNFWIFVTITGDLNADKWVDIYDAIILVGPIGIIRPMFYPWGDPRQAIRDLNDDGFIDIFDAILLANNYGKHWE